MNSGVRIIKRNRINLLPDLQPDQDERSGRLREREIASTVKNWIAELAQRRRAEESTLLSGLFLVRSK